jgi:hypothetical protein
MEQLAEDGTADREWNSRQRGNRRQRMEEQAEIEQLEDDRTADRGWKSRKSVEKQEERGTAVNE